MEAQATLLGTAAGMRTLLGVHHGSAEVVRPRGIRSADVQVSALGLLARVDSPGT
jgi:hypothetical protein